MMADKVLTANRVDDGQVVFFASDHSWTLDISHALIAESDPTRELLEQQLRLSDAGTEVTDIYLFDIERVAGAIRPVHIRERIRTLGPTVRGDLGKQANGQGGIFAAAV